MNPHFSLLNAKRVQKVHDRCLQHSLAYGSPFHALTAAGNHKLLTAAIALWNDNIPSCILEAGMGEGFLVAQLVALGTQVMAIECNPLVLRAIPANTFEEHLQSGQLTIDLMDLFEIPDAALVERNVEFIFGLVLCPRFATEVLRRLRDIPSIRGVAILSAGKNFKDCLIEKGLYEEVWVNTTLYTKTQVKAKLRMSKSSVTINLFMKKNV